MIRKIIQYITHDIWVKKEHEYKSRKMRWAVRQFKVFIFTALRIRRIPPQGALPETENRNK